MLAELGGTAWWGPPGPPLAADDEAHAGGALGARTMMIHGSDLGRTLGLESAEPPRPADP